MNSIYKYNILNAVFITKGYKSINFKYSISSKLLTKIDTKIFAQIGATIFNNICPELPELPLNPYENIICL